MRLIAICVALLTSGSVAAQTQDEVTMVMQGCFDVIAAKDFGAVDADAVFDTHGPITPNLTQGTVGTPADDFVVVTDINKIAKVASCDLFFADADLARASFDSFIASRDDYVSRDDYSGVCLEDGYIAVSIAGPESPLTQAFGKAASVNFTHAPTYGDDPC